MNATDCYDLPKPPYKTFVFIKYPLRWVACWIFWKIGKLLINTGKKSNK